MPLSSYLDRQRFTFGRDAPANSAISALRRPSEASSTMRARCTMPADIDCERVILSSFSRSPGRNINAGAGRFAMPHDFTNPTVKLLHTHDTSYSTRRGGLGVRVVSELRPAGRAWVLPLRGRVEIRGLGAVLEVGGREVIVDGGLLGAGTA